jgi:hypothetical protein
MMDGEPQHHIRKRYAVRGDLFLDLPHVTNARFPSSGFGGVCGGTILARKATNISDNAPRRTVGNTAFYEWPIVNLDASE